MNAMKMVAIMQLTACMFALRGVAGAQDQAPARNNVTNLNSELIGMVTKELKVAPDQAAGGAGAIFGLAKARLNSADFSRVAASVRGMDGLLRAAPPAKEEFLLNSHEPMAAWAVPLASLTGSFKSLGLSPVLAGKFVPILRNYIEFKGGSRIAALFASSVNDLVVCPYESASPLSPKGGSIKTAVLLVVVLFTAVEWSKKKLNSWRIS